LKRGIEQLMPMPPQKPEEFPNPTEALQNELLLPRRGESRSPTRDCHLHASCGQWPTSASDHRPHHLSIPRLQMIDSPPSFKPIGVLAVKGNALGRRRLADVAGIVTPDTILRWYRLLVAKKYDGSEMRRPGRPSTAPDLAALVARLANENPTWGYTRIRGTLQHLGHDVARNTIKAILQNYGIEPAPERGTKTPWKTFLAAHWDGLAAADFFTVEVLTWRGLVRYVVFFVMRLKRPAPWRSPASRVNRTNFG
jgi:hypothetical protein